MRIYISGLQVVAMTKKNLQFTPNNQANLTKQKSIQQI